MDITGMTNEEIDREVKNLLNEDLKFPESVADSVVRYLRAYNVLKDGIDPQQLTGGSF